MPYERNEMAKHLDIYNLAHDGTFRKRVQCAVYLDFVVASVWGGAADWRATPRWTVTS